MKTPQLIPVDLSKGNGHHHPDIDERKRYLARIGSEFYCGSFSTQWYGWNFNGGPWATGLQLDKPGTNCSRWQALWEIVTK